MLTGRRGELRMQYIRIKDKKVYDVMESNTYGLKRVPSSSLVLNVLLFIVVGIVPIDVDFSVRIYNENY